MFYLPKKEINDCVFVLDTFRLVPRAISYAKERYGPKYEIKKMALSQLYAIQRKFGLKLWSRDNEAPLDQFAMEYKPAVKFKSGILRLNHDDKQKEMKTPDHCGLCLTCDVLTSGIKDSGDDQLLIFIRKRKDARLTAYEHPISDFSNSGA